MNSIDKLAASIRRNTQTDVGKAVLRLNKLKRENTKDAKKIDSVVSQLVSANGADKKKIIEILKKEKIGLSLGVLILGAIYGDKMETNGISEDSLDSQVSNINDGPIDNNINDSILALLDGKSAKEIVEA